MTILHAPKKNCTPIPPHPPEGLAGSHQSVFLLSYVEQQ